MKSSAISLHYAEGKSVCVLQNSGFVSFVSSFLSISVHYAEGKSVCILHNNGFVSFVSSFLFPNQLYASGFFALPSTNFILAFPDDQFSDQSQAVQTWVQMGTSNWLEGRSTGSSHLPTSTQVLVEISSLGMSGVIGPCWLNLIVLFPRWVLVLSSGLPVRSRILFT